MRLIPVEDRDGVRYQVWRQLKDDGKQAERGDECVIAAIWMAHDIAKAKQHTINADVWPIAVQLYNRSIRFRRWAHTGGGLTKAGLSDIKEKFDGTHSPDLISDVLRDMGIGSRYTAGSLIEPELIIDPDCLKDAEREKDAKGKDTGRIIRPKPAIITMAGNSRVWT